MQNQFFFCLNEGNINETVIVCFISLVSISVLVILHLLEQVQYVNLQPDVTGSENISNLICYPTSTEALKPKDLYILLDPFARYLKLLLS